MLKSSGYATAKQKSSRQRELFFRRVCLPPKILIYKKCIKPLDFALKTDYTFFIRYIIIQK
mgnify:FL=1